MITPKGLPYQQGYGEAYIFNRPDLSGLRRYTDAQERNNVRLHQHQKEQEAKRQKLIDDILNKNYDLGAHRDVQVIGEHVNELRQYVTDELASGNRSVLKAGTPEWMKRKEIEDSILNAGKNSRNEYEWVDEAIKQIRQSSDKFLDKEKAMGIVLDYYQGADGAKNIFSDEYGNRPNWMEGAFNEGKWLSTFVDELPETVNESFRNIQAQDGTYIDSQEVKGKLFELDQQGNVVYENGKPVIKVTPETSALALQDARFRRHIELEMQKPENQGKAPHQLIADKLKLHGYANVSKQRKKGFTKKDNQGKGKKQQDQLFTRLEVVERTQKNIEEQMNAMIGGKLPDGEKITDANYDEENGRIWFNDAKYSIDVTADNNGGFEEIWNIYNTVPGYDKIDIGDALRFEDYQEQYPSPINRIDYGSQGKLRMDMELMRSAIDNSDSETAITPVLKMGENVNSVEWDDDTVEVEFMDGTTETLDLSKKDKRTEKALQDLLIKINKKRYQLPTDSSKLNPSGMNLKLDNVTNIFNQNQ